LGVVNGGNGGQGGNSGLIIGNGGNGGNALRCASRRSSVDCDLLEQCETGTPERWMNAV
jgi:hypothetical protein